MSHFPLNTAALCEDCQQVGDSLERCACCGSQSLLALAPTMNRDAGEQLDRATLNENWWRYHLGIVNRLQDRIANLERENALLKAEFNGGVDGILAELEQQFKQ